MNLKELLENRKGLLKIDIHSKNLGTIEEDLFEQLVLNQDDINEHIEVHAGLTAYWGMLLHIAESEQSSLKRKYELWLSEVYSEIEGKLWAEHDYKISFKPNINSVENGIKIRYKKEWEVWQLKLDNAKHNVGLLERIMRWFTEKGIMITQLAKLKLAELGSEGILFRHEKAEAIKHRLERIREGKK